MMGNYCSFHFLRSTLDELGGSLHAELETVDKGCMPCHQTCVDILMCPLVNISEEIRKFEDNSSRNSGIY